MTKADQNPGATGNVAQKPGRYALIFFWLTVVGGVILSVLLVRSMRTDPYTRNFYWAIRSAMSFNWGVFWAILATFAVRQVWVQGWLFLFGAKPNLDLILDRLWTIEEVLRDIWTQQERREVATAPKS